MLPKTLAMIARASAARGDSLSRTIRLVHDAADEAGERRPGTVAVREVWLKERAERRGPC